MATLIERSAETPVTARPDLSGMEQSQKAPSGPATGREKAALLLVTMGREFAADVFRFLREDEIDQLVLQIASVRKVDPARQEEVLEEARQTIAVHDYIEQGGIQYAREVLEKALGPARAADVLTRLTSTLQVRPFEFARQSDPAQLLNFIQGEHPQTIALVLAYLHPEQAALVLASLEAERQTDVIRRLALMDRTSPDIVKDVERVLERKVATLFSGGQSLAGGVDMAVAVLNRADRSTEKRILVSLETDDPELAQNLRQRMFVFEDIVLLDDRSLQRSLREVDLGTDLAMALKVASQEVKAKVFRNMSKHAATSLTEAIEYLGPVRLREVDEAQQRIVAVIRRLEDAGEVVVSRGGQDELIV